MEQSANVIEIKEASSLRIKFACGLDNHGRAIVKTRSYSAVKPDASSLDLYNVAVAIASLQQHDLMEILKQDSTNLC